ncbi:molybdopterin-binding protein [Sporomusa sphaeroides]|jgi:molybdopterin biosynthesis enzyme|uniref:molybdopterin-binding protein n=1 Tax=Sporomusa sphaeroides TaxID=47679 RepID=UPI002BB91AFD|nr:molybdopterin-binding protein [Sporomusa sphaeroides]HML33064.1 molybdopterin-binding protein [Sporomusa sphaeroides]
MAMRKVRVEEAVGMVLGHELTKIVPGEYKGPAFRKGHIIQPEDIVHLKNIGKDHIFLFELGPEELHENQAALRLAQAAAGPGVVLDTPGEGRVNLKAAVNGILEVNSAAVTAINMTDNVALATLHGGTVVEAGTTVAGAKIIPLVIDEELIRQVEAEAREYRPVVAVKPMKNKKVGIIVTGNEVFYGRITDKYAAVFAGKADTYGATLVGTVYQPGDSDRITASILDFKQQGTDIVIASGGMSVDPDDVTPDAIRATGAKVVTYGTPVLPGAMFMLAELDGMTIMGMPACGMYARTTVFDLVFPRLLADIPVTKADFAALGHGGLCKACKECVYPHCPFGK